MSCNKKVIIPCITPSLKSPCPSVHVSTSTLGDQDTQASLINYFWFYAGGELNMVSHSYARSNYMIHI